MPGRLINSENHRFGFNGQEILDEIKGFGKYKDFKFRGYVPRVGRFLNMDPIYRDYSWNSSFAFAENDIIRFIDLK